jgi:two-component system response regulator YesN
MINLLIMDDEEIIVDGLYYLLKHKKEYGDLAIYKAYYADEGLEIILNHSIDIVLSDISMPGMSGLELFQVVNRSKLNVKFIFLTAYDNFDYIQTAFRSGGFDYILKTEPDETIIAAIDRVVDRIKQEREVKHSVLEGYPDDVKQQAKALRLCEMLKSLEAVRVMLDSADLDQFHRYFDDIFKILQDNEALSKSMVEKAFYDISLMFGNYSKDNKLTSKLKQDDCLGKLTNVNHFETMDQLKAYYYELGQKIIDCAVRQDIETNHTIEYVNQYIREHINEDISVNRISELVYLNPSYFSRLYKQSTGVTVTNYIAEVKLEYAKHMLTDSNMKINQIAERLGFDSVSYFIRFFKKYMKYSPQDYRSRR